jgi:Glycosyl hydrolases family 2
MGTITDPKLWTAETPNLYVLVVSLYHDLESAEKGQGALDVETCRVGIRDVQFAGEGAQMTYLYFAPLILHSIDRMHPPDVSCSAVFTVSATTH